MNAFKQGIVDLPPLWRIGGGGNCASIAIIKSAIGTYGFDNVFKSIIVDAANKRYIIDLRDEDTTVYTLSFANYEHACKKSSFILKGDDQSSKDILEFANFCFAVMAEVKRNEYRINKSFERAINDLNKGESAVDIHAYLGLTPTKVKDVSIQNLSTLKNLIIWNPPHAVYASEGYYDEAWEEDSQGNKIEPIQPLNMLKEIHGDGSTNDNPVGAQFFH